MIRSSARRDTASRLIKAPPKLIYDAFVRPDAVAQWLPPQSATMEIQVFDPRVGGPFRMTLTFAASPGKSTANTDIVVGHFVDLVPQERIVQAFSFSSDAPAYAGTMTMTWTFKAAAEGTVVTVVAEDVPPGISPADHETGMNSSLANLAAYLERVSGRSS